LVDAVQPLGTDNSLIKQADITGLPHRIADAIRTAAAKTGVDFSYLLNKASQESGFDPNAKATTSSATGLFQFTSQTWLRTVKEHGADYGLSDYADHIQVDSNGVAKVSNPAWKQTILGLRKDPQISAEMAGELDKENLASLKSNVGGKIGATDLYLAHFLGAGGAADFLNKMKANPSAKAADVLPEAAAANPSVFYSDGQPRSLSQIYSHFAQKFDGKGSATMVASATPVHTHSYSHARIADSYNIASAAPTPVSVGGYTSPVTSGLKPDGSSLLATMILAQMNVGNGNQEALSSAAIADHSKKNAIDILGSIA